MKMNNRNSKTSKKKGKVMRFLLVLHIFIYATIMSLLVLIYFIAEITIGIYFFWPIYPILGWGIGLGIHLWAYGIYYEVKPFLAKLKTKSLFKNSFIFHGWIFTLVNLIVFFANINTISIFDMIYFHWPLLMWGIGFIIHGVTYITYDIILKKEMTKLISNRPDFTESEALQFAKSKIFNSFLLINDMIYFIAIQILIYRFFLPIDFIDSIYRTLIWGAFVIIHAIGYFTYFYNKKIPSVKKGVIIHSAFYTGINLVNILGGLLIQSINSILPLIILLFWGIFLVFHIFLAMKYDEFKEHAKSILTKKFKGIDPKKLQSKIKYYIAWEWTFSYHVVVYIVGIMIITMITVVLPLNLLILPIVALGWLIGLSAHHSLYWILMTRVRDFLKWTFRMHLQVYIAACITMIGLNLITGGIPWSVIAILGWGIGVGSHFILRKFLQK